jgi:hypothetical protein
VSCNPKPRSTLPHYAILRAHNHYSNRAHTNSHKHAHACIRVVVRSSPRSTRSTERAKSSQVLVQAMGRHRSERRRETVHTHRVALRQPTAHDVVAQHNTLARLVWPMGQRLLGPTPGRVEAPPPCHRRRRLAARPLPTGLIARSTRRLVGEVAVARHPPPAARRRPTQDVAPQAQLAAPLKARLQTSRPTSVCERRMACLR